MSLVPAVTTTISPTPARCDPSEFGSVLPSHATPLSDYVSHLAKRRRISVRDENIRSVETCNQTFNYADNLLASLTGAKNNFGKTLPRRARMIYAREADGFVVKLADATRRFRRFGLPLL